MPASPTASGRRASQGGEGLDGLPLLAHMPARDKLERLLQVGKGRRKVLVLTHDNPDPDSIASAVALGHVLERRAGLEARVGYGGIIGRAENIAFVRVLRLPVSPVSQIIFDEYDLLALVDTQPT